MGRIESFLLEYEQITKNVRITLERIPYDKFDWSPHEKSFSMGHLASHLVNLQTWLPLTLTTNEFDMHPKEGEEFVPPIAKNKSELLDMFDKNSQDAKKSLEDSNEDILKDNWSLLSGGNILFTMPKVAVVRSFVLNHTIHHNAQLGVYLRLNDIAVPAIFGPSADENIM